MKSSHLLVFLIADGRFGQGPVLQQCTGMSDRIKMAISSAAPSLPGDNSEQNTLFINETDSPKGAAGFMEWSSSNLCANASVLFFDKIASGYFFTSCFIEWDRPVFYFIQLQFGCF